jgi:hypothetical protein
MPIKITCSACGKSFNAPDAAAGKKVKCPGCQAVIAVPTGGNPAPATGSSAKPVPGAPSAKPAPGSKPAAAKATPTKSTATKAGSTPPGDLSDLFEQEGFKKELGARCPSCDAVLKSNAVICTACGFNLQTGQRVEGIVAKKSGGGHGGHGHGGDGEAQLQHAESMMERDKKLQEKLIRGSGMPWWMLLIVLFLVIGGACAFGIIMIDFVTTDKSKLGAMQRIVSLDRRALVGFIILFSFLPIATIGSLAAIIAGFKESAAQGIMVFLIPLYNLIFCIKRWKVMNGVFWMIIISGIGGGIGGALIAMGSR